MADDAEQKAMRERADRKPPQTKDPSLLAEFYFKRGRAARQVGRVRQTIKDLTRAIELGGAISGDLKGKILYYLALAEMAGGEHARGAAHIQQALAVAEQEHLRIEYGATLANSYVSDLKPAAARKQLDASEARARRLRRATDPEQRKLWRRYGGLIQGRLEHIRGRYLNLLGRYGESETFLRKSIAHYVRHYDRVDRRNRKKRRKPFRASPRNRLNHALATLGVSLLAQGRPLEAEVAVRKALLHTLKHRGRDDRRTVKFGHRLAWVMLRQGRPEDAETLERAMLQIMPRLGIGAATAQAGGSRKVLANALFTQGKRRQALEQFRILQATFRGDKTLADRFYALSSAYPLVLLENGYDDEALDAAGYALSELTRHRNPNPEDVALARGVMAVALMAQSRYAESLKEFKRAVPVLLESRRRSGFGLLDPVRKAQTRMALDSYIQLLARLHGTVTARQAGVDAVNVAFQVADAMRNQPVQRALNAAAARTAAGNRELSVLLRRLQDTIGQIAAQNAHYAELLSRPNRNPDASGDSSVAESIARLTAERDSLRAVIEARFPDYADLVSPKPPSLSGARDALRHGEALIAIYGGDTETYVWAVPKDGPAAFSVVSAGAERLARLVNRVRQGVSPVTASLRGIPDFDVAAAHELYRLLLAPVAETWSKANALVIVAHGVLAKIPFSMLATENSQPRDEEGVLFSGYRQVRWLARRYTVSALPTVSALTTLRKIPAAAPGRRPFIGFADPWFSARQKVAAAGRTAAGQTVLASRGKPLLLRAAGLPTADAATSFAALPALPDTADEVRNIAALMGADTVRDLYTGPRANEYAVKTAELSRYRIVAFASHALRPGELAGLRQPALALTAPDVAGVEGDGLLTAEEILGLRLDADWVVLSACNTAMGNGRGPEAAAGLGRAFLYAGARALLVSHWRVETVSAGRLITLLFGQYATHRALGRGEALRQAMLALMDGPGFTDEDGRTVFSYAHPVFWAPFSIVGEGGT